MLLLALIDQPCLFHVLSWLYCGLIILTDFCEIEDRRSEKTVMNMHYNLE